MHHTQSSLLIPLFVYMLGACFLAYVMGLQVSPGMLTADLMRDLHISATGLGLMSSVYFYTYTLMQIPAGLLFDRMSTRYLMAGAICVCACGAGLFAQSQTMLMASFARLLLGLGSSFAFISVLVIANKWFSVRYFALLVGVAQLLASFGAYGGTKPLAYALSLYSWREVLTVLAAAGLVLMLLTFFSVRDKANTVEGEQTSLFKTLKLILRNPQSIWVAMYAFCSWAPVTVLPMLWGAPFLMKAYSLTPIQAGALMGLIWIAQGVVSPFLGWISDWLGRRCIVMTLCALLGLIASVLLIADVNLSSYQLAMVMIAIGIATSGQVISFAVVRDIHPDDITASAIGFNNMAVVIPGALMQPLVGMLIQLHWNGQFLDGLANFNVADYRFALSVIPACFLLGLLISLCKIRETYCKMQFTSSDNQ